MKKIKLLAPFFCTGMAVMGVMPTITSCEKSEEIEHTFTLTGGDAILIASVDPLGYAANHANRAWYCLFDNVKIEEGVQFSLEFITESASINEIYIGKTDGIIKWNAPVLGEYEFYVVATYTVGSQYYVEKSDIVTLKVTDEPTILTPQGKYVTRGVEQEWANPQSKASDIRQIVHFTGFELINFADSTNIKAEIQSWDGGKQPSNVYIDFQKVKQNGAGSAWNLDIFTSIGTFFPEGKHTVVINITYSKQVIKTVTLKIADTKESFCNDSWANTIELANQGIEALKDYYRVDNLVNLQKTLRIARQDYLVRVIGVNHDTTQDGNKATLTFEFLSLYRDENKTYIRTPWGAEDGTNIWNDGTQSCMLRDFLNNDFADSLPAALKAKDGIKTVMKETNLGNGSQDCGTFPEYIWLESSTEIGNKDPGDMKDPIAAKEGTRYEAYTSYTASIDHNRGKLDENGNPQTYWLRSPKYSKTGQSGGAISCSSSGIFSASSEKISKYGIAPCFCI